MFTPLFVIYVILSIFGIAFAIGQLPCALYCSQRLFNILVYVTLTVLFKVEPIMLKNLPIILSQTSQIFDPLFYFIPISSPIIPNYSCNFYCINDNNVHKGPQHTW